MTLGIDAKHWYYTKMRLFNWLIAQATLFAVVLGVSLSSYGMAQAHAAMMKDASGITLSAQTMDHSSHATGDHANHDMSSVGHGQAHDGHANCPMIACCHMGGADTPNVSALADPVSCKYTSSANPQLGKAEPENAKKPPKHV
ncbi:hypothetical protein AAFO92_14995 [Roseovarius sp. CAU 1744]